MKARATAIGSERSNAIGVLELECAPHGLVIVHQGVGAFQAGYATGALTVGTRIVAPWSGVQEAAMEGDRLYLRLDETLSPHNRLLLTGFTTGDPPDPGELRRQRLLVRLGTGVAMVITALLVALTAVRATAEAGAGFALALGSLAAVVILFLGVTAEHRLGIGRVDADGARLAFATELSAYVPALARALRPDAPPPPPVAPPRLPSFQALLPRSTTAVVITMSAALLGAVLTATWVSREPARPAYRPEAMSEARPAAAPEPRAVVTEQPPAAPAPPAPPPPQVASAAPPSTTGDTVALSGECRCPRSDSLLWRDGIPRVSTVLIDRRITDHHGHAHLELELGLVNNWDQPVSDVTILVQFYERDPPPSTKRTPTFARPLYFEGPLVPGQAIKWHVDARGNDFDIEGAPSPMLDPSGTDAAPTSMVVDLLEAIHRPIRLHGAMLLAFLGDPRAKDAALRLREALREDEAPYIDRLAWALSDVRTCSVSSEGAGNARTIRACVYNASKDPIEKLALRARALDRPLRHDTPLEAPPLVIAERVLRLDGRLAAGQGAFATVVLSTQNPDGIAPQAFEAYADQEERVF
jgi:hypothetical protein